MLRVVEKTRIWFIISAIIIITGISFMIYHKGLNFGMDFKGGTIIKIDMQKNFNKNDLDSTIQKYVKVNTYDTTKVGSKELDISVDSDKITDANSTKLFNDIKKKYNLKDKDLLSRDRIGASIGSELLQKAILSLTVSIILMLLFIAWRFEFKFGIAAVIALIHDVLVTLSVYSILNLPVNSSFIAAILTIIGYSISDTIVIFDRIRENQKKMRDKTLVDMTDTSVSQTVGRSICTVTTTIVTIACVHIFVPLPSIRDFTLPILVGVASGCYSSIFIASPIWVILKKRSNKKRASLAN
ncbi:preprotein translocase subunit SecF [Clostridium acidisoli DSM 12555]|uniref:Protein-export membrane protein SecF n=1 Tax=Clostridium acidisoli DSM 12555 TaxID=1121291 RepID=A0A1W1XB21_9CLOT|nr:protein translocase subunit SecF [Clostridium acidisoli]SMC21235.1 preprotein translocase subunit SecF [Clostridium acidisoli DSM 12555]